MRKVLYILGELEDGDLQWLLDAGSPRTVPAGETIIREGEPLDRLFIVVDGELVVTKGGREVARLGAGEVVGDMSLLDERLPTATVTAGEETRVHAVPKETLRAQLARDPRFAARFYRALCIFLANRLTQATAGGAEAEDEISASALEGVALAGARFDWFLSRVRGA